MSDSLQPHKLQHGRLPCSSLSPRVCSNSCSLRQWCHPTISSCVALFCCLQTFPASESFQMSQKFASGGQSMGTSASASVLPMNIQGWYPLVLTGLISFLSKGQESSPAPQFESINSSALSLPYGPTPISILDYWNTIALTIQIFVGKVTYLLFNMLSRFVIALLPRSKHFFFNFMAAIANWSDFGAPKNKFWHCFHCFPIYLPWSDGTRCHDLRFLCLSAIKLDSLWVGPNLSIYF